MKERSRREREAVFIRGEKKKEMQIMMIIISGSERSGLDGRERERERAI